MFYTSHYSIPFHQSIRNSQLRDNSLYIIGGTVAMHDIYNWRHRGNIVVHINSQPLQHHHMSTIRGATAHRYRCAVIFNMFGFLADLFLGAPVRENSGVKWAKSKYHFAVRNIIKAETPEMTSIAFKFSIHIIIWVGTFERDSIKKRYEIYMLFIEFQAQHFQMIQL